MPESAQKVRPNNSPIHKLFAVPCSPGDCNITSFTDQSHGLEQGRPSADRASPEPGGVGLVTITNVGAREGGFVADLAELHHTLAVHQREAESIRQAIRELRQRARQNLLERFDTRRICQRLRSNSGRKVSPGFRPS